jgi:hypothetical protein
MTSKHMKKLLLHLGLASILAMPFQTMHAGRAYGQNGLSENDIIGLSCIAGFFALMGGMMYLAIQDQKALDAEPADNIPNYLREVERSLIHIEGHEYLRAWMNGEQWQVWLQNKVNSCTRASEVSTIYNELQRLPKNFARESLRRAEHLSKKYGMYSEQCLTLYNRASKIEHAIREMTEIAQKRYNQLTSEESLTTRYQTFYNEIVQLQRTSIFTIDINTIKTYAYSSYPNSPWPYIDMINHIDTIKKQTIDLYTRIKNAPTHQRQAEYMQMVDELHKRTLWAIDFITKDPHYATQYNVYVTQQRIR